jgi:hypothetical protein
MTEHSFLNWHALHGRPSRVQTRASPRVPESRPRDYITRSWQLPLIHPQRKGSRMRKREESVKPRGGTKRDTSDTATIVSPKARFPHHQATSRSGHSSTAADTAFDVRCTSKIDHADTPFAMCFTAGVCRMHTSTCLPLQLSGKSWMLSSAI